jgi:two-component system, LuxR family, sensor kinase FixL
MSLLQDIALDLARDSDVRRMRRAVRQVSIVLLFCVGYYAAGIVGILLGFPPSGIAAIWPPTAILLAALLLTSPRLWWAYLLAVVPTHLHLVAYFQQPSVPLVVMLFQVASNATHAVLGALAVRHVVGAPPRFDSLRNMATFILLAAFGATAVACALAVTLFLLTGWATDFWLAWRQRVLANVFAIITIPPLILLTVAGQAVTARRGRQQYGELGFLALGLLAVSTLVFSSYTPGPATSGALLFAPLPLLLWAAVRLGSGGLALSLLIVAGVSLVSASAGRGPFVAESTADNVLSLQVFLLAISLPLMLLAALVEERNLGEQALAQNEARYRAVVEDQTELICRFQPDGTYTFVNGAYCRYFKRSAEELIGHTFWEFIPPEGRQGAREFLDSITPDHPVASREHEVLAPGGELRWQQWRDRGFFDDHGRVVEYQAVGRDITDLKRAEEAVQRQREELAHALRVMTLGELTASFAHEINQPLAAIMSNAQATRRLLDTERAKPAITDALTDIVEAAKRASQIIQRLRTLFRKEHAERTVIDINALITDVVSLLRTDLQRRTISVSLALAETVPPVLGDSVQLQQVMLNLVVNACEAIAATEGASREIVVETRQAEPGRLAIVVCDSGIGVREPELERIFEHFVTSKPQGLGMGLAISRSIVQAHGGRIWATANHDRGLTLHVELPAHGGGQERDASFSRDLRSIQ